MSRRRIIVSEFYAYVFLLLSIFGCTKSETSFHKNEKALQEIVKSCDDYNRKGRTDSVITVARPYFKRALYEKDTTGVQLTGAYLAQAYVLNEICNDSIQDFLDTIEPYFRNPDTRAAGIFYTAKGHIALRYDVNYPEALLYYLKAYEYAEIDNNINNQIVMLYNIVNIFCTRSDENGYRYAEKALQLVSENDVNPYYKVAANAAMAQVCFLSKEFDNSLTYASNALKLSEEYGISGWGNFLDALFGDIYRGKKEYTKSAYYYSRAVSGNYGTDEVLLCIIYLNFGQLYEDMGIPDKALEMYSNGLEISDKTGSMEFREDLLKSTADILYVLGEKSKSLEYYNEYSTFIDSLQVKGKVQRFNNQLLSYSEMQYKYDIARRNLELSEYKRKLMASIFVIAVIVILAAMSFILYLKQKRYYTEAVRKYEDYSRRLEAASNNEYSDCNDTYHRLYQAIESKMKDGTYRQKDLTLDKMAALLCSNRTYVSNTINKIAGTSFNSYINRYRIREAIHILSAKTPDKKISMKEISDYLGYNSVQVFNKVFKEETGVSPGIYRSEMLKKTTNNNE